MGGAFSKKEAKDEPGLLPHPSSTNERSRLKKQATVYGFGEHGFAERNDAKNDRIKKAENRIEVPMCCPTEKDKAKVLPEYNTEQFILKVLFAWHGTVYPLVFKMPYFWLLMFWHIGLRSYEIYSGVDLPPVEGWVVSMPASLLIFVAVFYSGQCYNRFFQMYSHCVGISAATMVWVGLVKLHIPTLDAEFEEAEGRSSPDPLDHPSALHWNACRFVLAASHVLYYTFDGGKMEPDDWETLRARKLLNVYEIETVRKYNGYKPFLLIYWGLVEVRHQLKEDGAVDDRWRAEGYNHFQELAIELRAHCGQLTNLLRQPVPWAYYHLVNLMTVLVLALVGYGFVGTAHMSLTSIAFAVVCLTTIGLKELAVAMADPFGDDVIDFQLEKFLAAMYQNALAHLEDAYSPRGTELCKDTEPPIRRPPPRDFTKGSMNLSKQTSVATYIDDDDDGGDMRNF